MYHAAFCTSLRKWKGYFSYRWKKHSCWHSSHPFLILCGLLLLAFLTDWILLWTLLLDFAGWPLLKRLLWIYLFSQWVARLFWWFYLLSAYMPNCILLFNPPFSWLCLRLCSTTSPDKWRYFVMQSMWLVTCFVVDYIELLLSISQKAIWW